MINQQKINKKYKFLNGRPKVFFCEFVADC